MPWNAAKEFDIDPDEERDIKRDRESYRNDPVTVALDNDVSDAVVQNTCPLCHDTGAFDVIAIKDHGAIKVDVVKCPRCGDQTHD